MRIITGSHRGKKIVAPKKLPVRPTTDMAKEALFNILHNSYTFGEVSVLDLYAGTGNISYEFASRGSQPIIAVDANPRCIRFIQNTAKALGFPITPIKSGVLEYLAKADNAFNIIFADPPYNQEASDFENLLHLVFEKELIKEDGVLVIEHSEQSEFRGHTNFINSRKYGSSVFSFFS